MKCAQHRRAVQESRQVGPGRNAGIGDGVEIGAAGECKGDVAKDGSKPLELWVDAEGVSVEM